MLLRGLYKVEKDDKGRMIRRNLIRYITLSYCIALRYFIHAAGTELIFLYFITTTFSRQERDWEIKWNFVWKPVFLFRTVSFRLKKRFPTLEHLVHAGIMRADEYRYTGWPVKHGRVFLVPWKKWLFQCTCEQWCKLDKSVYTRYQKNTAMFIWSPCIWI